VTSSAGAAPRDRFPWIAGALYVAATFAWYCVWRHFLAERSSDEAYFENCLWNAVHGNGLRTWIEGEEGRGQLHLALHFSPVIYLFVPLYALFPSMHVVHLAISAGVAGAGVLFHRMARERLGRWPARLLTLAFLLHPTVILQTVMEAHEQALAFFPLLLMIHGYRRGSVTAALTGGLFFLAVREDNLLFVVALAVLAAAARRDLRLAGALAVLSAVWIGFYAWLGIHVLGGGEVSHLFAVTYGHLGNTPSELIRNVVQDPMRAVRHVASPVPLAYLAQLLGPFLVLLPLADPIALAAAPQVMLILLADHAARAFHIRLHYSVVPVAVLYVACIAGLARLAPRSLALGRRRPSLALVAAGVLFVLSLASVPVWFVRALGRLHPERERVIEAMRVVPDTASVTAPGFMLNHMAGRRLIAKTWSGPLTTTEYVILEDANKMFYEGISGETHFTPAVADTLARAGYRPVWERDGRHVWKTDGPLPELPGHRPTPRPAPGIP
jgi:uncharacterized membrane protein